MMRLNGCILLIVYICLAVIIIDYFLKKGENYYLQVFLKQCNYIEKEKKVID